jgi:hypothetical protein
MFGIAATYVTKFISTPGHGYLVVEKAMLRQLGIADKVSDCSYQRNGSAYLEEDVDAPLFLAAMEKAGFEVSYTSVSVDDDYTDKMEYYSA